MGRFLPENKQTKKAPFDFSYGASSSIVSNLFCAIKERNGDIKLLNQIERQP